MAFVANTAFEARITNNEFDNLANITGKYYVSTTETDCSAGLLCVRGDNLDCEGFTGIKNENAFKMTAAAATVKATDGVFACNTYDTKKVNGYYIGTETLGLGVPAGEYGTFTRINFDGESVYRFGVGNIDGEVGAKTVFSIKDGKLKPESAAPTTANTPYFTLRGTGNFTEGTSASFAYYDVVACKTVVATA